MKIPSLSARVYSVQKPVRAISQRSSVALGAAGAEGGGLFSLSSTTYSDSDDYLPLHCVLLWYSIHTCCVAFMQRDVSSLQASCICELYLLAFTHFTGSTHLPLLFTILRCSRTGSGRCAHTHTHVSRITCVFSSFLSV
jgi:hypothetical protein